MKKCPYCHHEMITIEYNNRVEYECWDCKKAFVHKFNLLDKLIKILK